MTSALDVDPRDIPEYPYGVLNRIWTAIPTENKTDSDYINCPAHYCEGRKIQPIEVINDWGLGYCLGNVLKYLARYDRKGAPIEDLKKARRYLDMQIEYMEKREAGSCG